MSRSQIFMTLAILAFAQSAAAQVDDDRFSDRLELRELRQEASAPVSILKATDAPELTLQLGASFVDSPNGSEAFSTPFSIRGTFGKTTVRIGSDFQYVDEGASNRSGFGDVLLAANHQLYERIDPRFLPERRKHKLLGEIGFFAPMGGDVGSSHSRERLGVSYAGPLTEGFSLGTKVQLTRRSADPKPGESRLTRTLTGDLGYAIDSETEVSSSLTRSHRSGAGGTTKAGVTYTDTLKAGPKVSFGYVRGLTKDAKDHTFEASVRRTF